jgi:hypothetical protein
MLLSSIKVYNEQNLSKDYEFSYTNDQYSKLNSISLVADGVQYNPTIINWGTTDYSNPTVVDMGDIFVKYFPDSYPNPVRSFGNLNDDGLTDIVSWNQWGIIIQIAKLSGGYNSTKFQYHWLDPEGGIRAVNLVDWNNDGKDELMVSYSDQVTVKANETTWNQYIDMYNYDPNGINYSKTTTDLGYDRCYKFYYADFNNDGVMDRLTLTQSGAAYSISCENLNTASFAPASGDYVDIKLLDFDGDGQLEVLLINRTAIAVNLLRPYYGSIWKYDGSTFVNILGEGQTTWPSQISITKNGVPISTEIKIMSAQGGNFTKKLFVPFITSSVVSDNELMILFEHQHPF